MSFLTQKFETDSFELQRELQWVNDTLKNNTRQVLQDKSHLHANRWDNPNCKMEK